ncbi:FadR/GntR family transcriptional regulator [Halodesulfovibrio sp.]|jgi:GntR family transcriptional repressor for pyruvate dehydrogenase complex|uniref:FadR/GntR family transcriptional regulator n=1 Tax=Halodesulfovibrio sp. TaxID=1912772 RepID=UPI0025E26149|nr:FadR/GntR family transcriptional regulator [Halodesulfovibrio sp.]MCT4626234.1 FadR family transcriptional regulator [Halodesulfovibrio sp.]
MSPTKKIVKAQNPNQRRVHESIVKQLHDLITRGEFPPGKRLPSERKLAEIFAVSRHGVREALRKLEEQGLVFSRQGDGTYVRKIEEVQGRKPVAAALDRNKCRYVEVLELRKVIEPQIAALAARYITEEELAELRRVLDEQIDEIAQGRNGAEADCEFHKLIAAGTRNSVMLEMVTRIHDIVAQSLEFTLENSHRRHWAVETHERILRALENKDPETARKEMYEHIAYVESLALSELEEEE